jgi:hypothetical protein
MRAPFADLAQLEAAAQWATRERQLAATHGG